MKAFDYAAPRDEAGVLELLSDQPGRTALLAGGTDLVPLMKKMLVTPERVVNIKAVDAWRGIHADSKGVTIGAVTTLDELLEAAELDPYPAVKQVIRGINSMQLQAQGTLAGELFQRPRCWYFRSGHGFLADRGRLVAEGDNRYHAIFGNAGPAKFVSASRIAPALIALGARVRIAGPAIEDESILPLEALYRTPRDERQSELALLPNQVATHVMLPRDSRATNAAYEVRASEGPDDPLASAAAALVIEGGIVRQAAVVLGQVAPVPWTSREAADALLGRGVSHETAERAGEAAIAAATPLSENGYKVRLARVAVKRAILLAAGLEHGGF